MENIKNIGLLVFSIIAVCFILYGCYWIAKTLSYSIFYEDMVRQTITEMVKAGALN